MALTVTKVAIVDPSRPQLDFGTTALDSVVHTVDITLGATTDYSSGVDLTSSILIGSAGVNVSQVIGVLNATVRSSGGTAKPFLPNFNQNTKKLQLFRSNNTLFANAVQRQNQTNVLTAPLAANAFTLKANTLGTNGQALRFRCGGTRAAAAGAPPKIELLVGGTIAQPPVGGTIIATLTGTANAAATNWFLDTIIHRTGAATQQIQAVGSMVVDNSGTLTNAIFTNKFSTGTFDLTTDLTIMPTLTSTNTNEITVEWQTADLIGPGTAQGTEIVPGTDLAAGDIIRCSLVCV